jgi:hypothetical protein
MNWQIFRCEEQVADIAERVSFMLFYQVSLSDYITANIRAWVLASLRIDIKSYPIF